MEVGARVVARRHVAHATASRATFAATTCRPPSDLLGYSARNAWIGSIDAARRAGITLAIRAAPPRRAATVTSVATSHGGVSNSSLLLGNGIEGTLRVNLTRRRLQPYLFGGAGWTHYQLANTTTNTSSVLGKDDVGTIPMGAGLSVRLGDSFIIDARGTYRATFNDDLMRGTATSGNSMQSWNASARAGFEF